MSGRTLQDLVRALKGEDWLEVRDALNDLESLLKSGAPSGDGSGKEDGLASRLSALSAHAKWEIRKAVAHVAQYLPDEDLQRVLVPLLDDSNTLVRDAARTALVRFSQRPREAPSSPRSDAVERLLASIEARWGKKARDAANRVATKETERFVREACHELTAIVASLDSSVSSLANAIKKGPLDEQTLLKKAIKAQERVLLLSRVLESLRSFVTQTAVEFHAEKLRDMVVEATGVVRDGVNKNGRELWTEILVPDDLVLDAHRGKLVQAFRNVIQNGLEAYDGLDDRLKKIRIACEVNGESSVVLKFTDAGCGLSAEDREDALRMFVSKKKGDVHGVGLPLTKKIVEVDHAGSLSLESKEGEGTTVTIRLPIEQDRSLDT